MGCGGRGGLGGSVGRGGLGVECGAWWSRW